MIEITNLTKVYDSRPVIDDITIKIEGNQIVGLLGQNGSGKTTLLKIIAGLIQDYKGSVKVDGLDLSEKTKAKINFMASESSLDKGWSVEKTINFYEDMFDDFDAIKAQNIISDFGLNPKQKIKNMSTGMQEKLEIALTMSRQSDIYLLDEPLGGIDVSVRRKILEGIIKNYSEGALMIISTHLISEIETIIDRALIIKDGKIFEDIMAEDIRSKTGQSIEDHFVDIFEEA